MNEDETTSKIHVALSIKKITDEFFENPIHRLIFARLGQIDGEKIDWHWVKKGDKKK